MFHTSGHIFLTLAGRVKVLSPYSISLVQVQCMQVLFNAEHRGHQIPVLTMPGPDPLSPILLVGCSWLNPDKPDYLNHPNFQHEIDEEADPDNDLDNDQDSGLITRSLNLTNL